MSYARQQPWFRGGSLVEELSFVHYFHSDSRNRALHLCSSIATLFMVAALCGEAHHCIGF